MIATTPPPRAAWTVSFASMVNALSIPLIAALLWWVLDRVLTPADWCPALEEFKTPAAAGAAALRCQPILIAQLDIGKYCAIGLVGALALSHIVSVAREARASFDLSTKLGSVKIGGDAVAEARVEGAQQVAGAADEKVEQIKDEVRP